MFVQAAIAFVESTQLIVPQVAHKKISKMDQYMESYAVKNSPVASPAPTGLSACSAVNGVEQGACLSQFLDEP